MNAATVSRKLAQAGLPRASRYSTWGREKEGFQVIEGRSGRGPVVFITERYGPGKVLYERVQAALIAAGIPFERYGRPGVGGDYAVQVIREPVETTLQENL